jgi:hypothetical protein
MKTRLTAAVFASLFGAAALVGCDEKVAEHKDVQKKADGTTVEKKDEVTKKADGTTVSESSKTVDRPGTTEDSKTKVKVEEKP